MPKNQRTAGFDVDTIVGDRRPRPSRTHRQPRRRRRGGRETLRRGRRSRLEHARRLLRSRQTGCVVFTVDEKLTGRPQVSNDAVIEFAAQNADIAMAFVSLDPTRGADAVREARRLVGGRRLGLEASSAAAAVFSERSRRVSAL